MKPLLPRDVLFALLPAAFEPYGSSTWYPSQGPTRESVERINAELAIVLPEMFIDIAQACPAYGGWFNSIGEDYASHGHILCVNADWHAAGMPSRYVLFNHGHDGHCDAWDTEGGLTAGELPIVHFDFEWERNELRHLCASGKSFARYLDGFVRTVAVRSPIKSLRRAAKRMLEPYK